MKRLASGLVFLFAYACALPPNAGWTADGIQTKTTYAKAYGETKNAVAVDPAKDLPRYPAVEPQDALATWQVKAGFKLELAAHEPQVCSPIAICFDENGRMFVCEMIDYSERRDVTPHLGRISMLEDKDGDGQFETSTVFADDLPWPTGLIWAHGGLYVGATPDIWRLEDKDGDGRAELREKVYTGFGTGLKILNVQGLMNSFQWGQDNRIHVLAGGGNRGLITCLKRPELKGVELGGKDFWFDPRTHEFGLEGGGAQYGMSFDDYGRKFGCSNSDHLQYWVYDERYVGRNAYHSMPPARQSIAVDGGAAEVFRISPDEPWRIIRTRWRIAGVVKGAVEGGGRVSGYFTGATGTTIYRGDAYGPEFVNNSFTGDAGGQLVHRKIIRPSADGISLVGERPQDEHGFEFAASKDTWVRVVNFANAPDGCLYICDMYREVIEHPWSIPDEIKNHIDLNSGSDRGRIYRILPTAGAPRVGQRVKLAQASTEALVQTLAHPNGWHRDTAQRLLYERQDLSAATSLRDMLAYKQEGSRIVYSKLPEEKTRALFRLHALAVLDGLGALNTDDLTEALLMTTDPRVQQKALHLCQRFSSDRAFLSEIGQIILSMVDEPAPPPRLVFDAAMLASSLDLGTGTQEGGRLVSVAEKLLRRAGDSELVRSALLSGTPDHVPAPDCLTSMLTQQQGAKAVPALISFYAARGRTADMMPVVEFVAQHPEPALLQALGKGLHQAGTTLEKVDVEKKLMPVFAKAASTAQDATATEATRLSALELLGHTTSAEAVAALTICLKAAAAPAVQAAAVRILAQSNGADMPQLLLQNWPQYSPVAKEAVLQSLLVREDGAVALLESQKVKPQDFSAAQVQALIKHKSAKVVGLAKKALVEVIPPSREEVTAKYKPAAAAQGDAVRGMNHFISRCMACHRAGTLGVQVGPDLITVKTKGREALLTAILEPHKEVASQYIAYTVTTKNGQTFAGIIADDTASSMTLRMMGGSEKTLQRAEIQGSNSTGQSLMPEGLETGLSVQDMADILSYIESL